MGLSHREIARELQRTPAIISTTLSRLGITRAESHCRCGSTLVHQSVGRKRTFCSSACATESRKELAALRRLLPVCKECGADLPRLRWGARYCSRTCSQRFWYKSTGRCQMAWTSSPYEDESLPRHRQRA